MTEIRLENEAATIAYAQELATNVKPGQVIALSGELGAGKSVFARAMMRTLGVIDEALPSPTFSLIQTYDGKDCQVVHMDWYRLDDASDIEMLDVRDYFQKPWIAIIEWPDRATELFGETTIFIRLACVEDNPDVRLIEIAPALPERGLTNHFK